MVQLRRMLWAQRTTQMATLASFHESSPFATFDRVGQPSLTRSRCAPAPQATARRCRHHLASSLWTLHPLRAACRSKTLPPQTRLSIQLLQRFRFFELVLERVRVLQRMQCHLLRVVLPGLLQQWVLQRILQLALQGPLIASHRTCSKRIDHCRHPWHGFECSLARALVCRNRR